jgi:hypothetical protein
MCNARTSEFGTTKADLLRETQRQHAETDGYHLVTEWRQQQGPETKKD